MARPANPLFGNRSLPARDRLPQAGRDTVLRGPVSPIKDRSPRVKTLRTRPNSGFRTFLVGTRSMTLQNVWKSSELCSNTRTLQFAKVHQAYRAYNLHTKTVIESSNIKVDEAFSISSSVNDSSTTLKDDDDDSPFDLSANDETSPSDKSVETVETVASHDLTAPLETPSTSSELTPVKDHPLSNCNTLDLCKLRGSTV
uniref:Uncharacterized protein n=1 Tax=Ananas comosus var. bracteatus TaxID=296719 RepID=A0A6V7PFE7_ANACO|nr:unnamed protein product [Ananas comosus var. bracteatus]